MHQDFAVADIATFWTFRRTRFRSRGGRGWRTLRHLRRISRPFGVSALEDRLRGQSKLAPVFPPCTLLRHNTLRAIVERRPGHSDPTLRARLLRSLGPPIRPYLGDGKSIMTSSSRIAAYLMSALLWGLSPRLALADDYEYHHENVMGTSLELRVRAVDGAAAQRAEDRVLHEIDRSSAIFSGYDAASEFSRWQSVAETPARVSPELFEVLQASDAWRTRSWRRLRPSGRSPCRGSGRTSLDEIGYRLPRRPPVPRA